jgi:glucosamine-6-phosphate deaminase
MEHRNAIYEEGMGMRLIVAEDYEAMSRIGAAIVADVIAARPEATLLVATGETPMGLYRELAARRERGELDASRLRVVQLDEYLGIGPDDRRSLYGWMLRSFVAPLGVPVANVIRLPGQPADPGAACQAFDDAVEAAGCIDLAILGLGPNGHLGFNEPPVAADAPTRVVALTAESVQSNARYWGGVDQVPPRALTAGMAVLLAARQALLVVSGSHKREILARTLHGPISGDVPASYLRRAADVTVLADHAAAGEQAEMAGGEAEVV